MTSTGHDIVYGAQKGTMKLLAAQQQLNHYRYMATQAEAFPLQRAKENEQIALEKLQRVSWIKRYLKGRWF